jgi:ADP-L-glycero-D-manno-heptose 6-epimerase
MPEGLEKRYQAFTQADLTQLRAAGCEVEFRPVENGTASYVRWLLEQQS